MRNEETMCEGLLSVVIPVYNIRDYVERCVRSVLAQPDVPLEVLIVDDGSTDDSGAVCDALAAEDSRVTVIHKPNGGLSDARNYGLCHAQGEYILFMDGDDWLTENVCPGLLQMALQTRADVVIGKVHFLREEPVMTRWEEAVEETFTFHTVYTGKEYLLKCLQTGGLRVEVGRHLYRTDFLRTNGLQFCKGILHEDEEFTPRVLLQAQRVVLTGQEIYYYDNCRAGSITHAEGLSTRRVRDRLRIYDSLAEIYRTVTPRALRRRLQDDLCWKYLDCAARFDCRTLPGYRPQRLRMLQFACTPRRRAKAALFALSPELFRRVMNHCPIDEERQKSMAQHARIKRTPPPDGARRRWWQNRLLQLLAAFVLLCGVAAAGLKLYTDYTNSHFQVTFYRVTSSHVSEKLRVLFLSDLHLREYGEHNEELIQTVQELDPDLILLGGDLVTFSNPEYENMLSLCRSLADVAPLYGVLGNHESEMIYGGVDDQLAEKFSEAGVQLLRNETRTIQIGENNVELIGLEGALKDFYKYGASDCVESLSRQYDTFRICINHVPMAFVDYMQDAPFDLALAGHTHGGLIRLPVLGRLYTAEEGLFPEYAGGMYQLDSGAPLIVGCGLGDSNQIPRVYNPPELVLVDVNWY